MRQGKAGVRQIKVSPAFSKAAVGKAEPYGLKPAQPKKKSRAAPARRWCPVGTVQRRSTLPLRSVLGVCHWQTAPEPAGETAQRIGRGPVAEAPYLSFPQSIAPGAGTVAPCLLFPQAKLRSLGQNNRGTYVPPFFVYGKAVASPPHPCKVLGFHPKPHKPFEKGLSENFTFLHLTQARGRYVPVGRCPAADRAGRRDKG